MSKGYLTVPHPTNKGLELVVGHIRICYVRAWDDPQWREQNGLPPRAKSTRGGRKPVARLGGEA